MERVSTVLSPFDKAKKHFPKLNNTFFEVLSNTAKITGGGDAFTSRIVKTFLDEVLKATQKYGRLTIPNVCEIYVISKPEKTNNIKKAERWGRKIEIVPEHYAVIIKPHVTMRDTIRKKNPKTPFMVKPRKADLGIKI